MPSSTQKSEMCIRYAAWVLWPIFTFSLSVLTFFTCHFARLKMPVYEDTEGNGRWGRSWTGLTDWLTDWRAFIISWNVVLLGRWGGNGDHRLARSVGGVELSLDQSDGDVLRTGASKRIGVGLFVFIFLSYVLSESKSFCSFCFLVLDHTTCHSLAWLLCTGNKHVEHIFDMICLGQNREFLHRRLRFSGYLVYLQMLPFCILQRVSKHCVAMLILLNLHWQAALMVFFMCLFGYSFCLWPLTVLDYKQLVVKM